MFKYNFLLKTFVYKTLNRISLNKETSKIIYKGIKQKLRSDLLSPWEKERKRKGERETEKESEIFCY